MGARAADRAAELFDVAGKVTVVTGAASGLGLAMSEVMAANGAVVIMADIAADRLDAEQRRLQGLGGQVHAAACDVTDAGQVRGLVERVLAGHGRIDVVFANAGVSIGPGFTSPEGCIENVDPAVWERVLGLNLSGVFHTLQAVAPHFKERRSGKFIVTDSIAGLRAEPIIGYAYVAAKHGVSGLVRQAALEMAAYNVQVNAIAPGPFLTGIGGSRLHTEEFGQLFASKTPMGRLAHPDEIKGVALLLASSASSYMTGTVVSVDGGWVAR